MYAVVETGGKQYRVSPGEIVDVDRLPVEGGTVELDNVYVIADGEKVSVGKPTIAGAKVIADVIEQGKGDKVTVFKYKPKVRYHVKKGHRQQFTRLAIKEIIVGKGKGK